MERQATWVPGRYARSFRLYLYDQADDVAENLRYAWPLFLAVTIVVAAVLVVSLHLLAAFAVGRGVVGDVAGLAPSIILAVALLWLLLWIYWSSKVDPSSSQPYIIAVMSSVLTVGVCVEAFAGVTLMLWQHGMLDVAGAAAPSLWAAEQAFGWRLLDAVPLLGITSAMHLDEPAVLTGQFAGALALTFTVVLLGPVVRLAIAGYHHARSIHRSMLQEQRWARERRRKYFSMKLERYLPGGLAERPTLFAWVSAGYAIITAGLAVAAIMLLLGPATPGGRLVGGLVGRVPDPLDVGVAQVHTDWLLWAIEITVVALILWPWGIFGPFVKSAIQMPKSPGILAGFLMMCVTLLFAAVGGATAVLLVLEHLGLAQPRPSRGGSSMDAANWLFQNASEAIPALDVAGTLHWQSPVEYVDRWAGGLLVVLRLVIVLVVVLVVPWLIGSWMSLTFRARSEAGLLSAPQAYVDALDGALTAYDKLEKLEREEDKLPWGSRRSPGHQLLHERREQVVAAVTQAAAQLHRVQTLFGTGASADAAEAALAAVEEHHHLYYTGAAFYKDDVNELFYDSSSSVWEWRSPPVKRITDSRLYCLHAASEFRHIAREEMASALGERAET